jgi:hypothetical protein
MNRNNVFPLFVIGCVRSGTTIFHKLLLEACPKSLNLTDDDFESRTFWQEFTLKIGSRRTGTFCLPAKKDDILDAYRRAIVAYVNGRRGEGQVLINKNTHLMNKIGFVAEVIPTSRFVFIIREIMSTVSSTKHLFENMNLSNEDYPPFIHYWPDHELPCWYTIRNDRLRPQLTFRSVRRIAKKCAYGLRLKRLKDFTAPSRIFEHERFSSFYRDHPDRSRYYPGEGFARIPESWITLNINTLDQLQALDENRWMSVTYKDVVSNTQGIVERILGFIGIDKPELGCIPKQLDFSRSEKWRKGLSKEEKETVKALVQQRSLEFERMCRHFGTDLMAFLHD